MTMMCVENPTEPNNNSDRSVTFAPTIEVKHCPKLENEMDIQACWFTCQELHEIKAEIKKMISIIDENNSNSESKTTDVSACCRGLQGRTKAEARQQRAIRSLAVESVLREQKLQREEGITDPEMIAISYQDVCINNQRNAHLRGVSDAKVAEELYQETIISTSPSSSPSSSPTSSSHRKRMSFTHISLRQYIRFPKKMFSSAA